MGEELLTSSLVGLAYRPPGLLRLSLHRLLACPPPRPQLELRPLASLLLISLPRLSLLRPLLPP